MRNRRTVWIWLCASLLAAACQTGEQLPGGTQAAANAESPPNIIFIMADDLGYGELGSYGQEKIRTPHLDRMAQEGIRFTQFYSGSPVCASARATLLTGLHTGHSYVRDNYGEGSFADDDERGQLPLPPGTRTVGTVLQEAGYTTGIIGKWGLGGPGTTGLPSKQGFDFFYGYLDQKQAHNYYPTHLWRGTEEETVWDTLANDYFHPHQRLDEPPSDASAYDAFKGKEYAPDLMQRETLAFLERHRDDRFFLYLAPTIPHVALQVPDEELAAYDFEEEPYLGDNHYLPHPRPRAAYAGMISRLDAHVGELLERLEELGLAENTLVVFTSDNGPTYVSGVDVDFFESTGGLRGLKGSVYEGGIRVPMIAWWPGTIEPRGETEHVAALWDVLPSMAELAGLTPPEDIDGVSFAPTLLDRPERQQEHDYLYWTYFGLCEGQQAVRMGKWKGVRLGAHTDPEAPMELYDLEADPGETRNVASENPDVVRQLWKQAQAAQTPPVMDRWTIAQAAQPLPSTKAGPHACFPWNDPPGAERRALP